MSMSLKTKLEFTEACIEMQLAIEGGGGGSKC